MSKSLSLFSLTLLLAVVVLFTGAEVVSAANQVVSDCGDNGGANQLRAKIDAAQSSGGGTITFTCGPFITLLGGELPTIYTNVTINGGAITISGNNASRHFVVEDGTLTLNNMTLTNGYANYDGGSVYNDVGTLNVSNVKFVNNQTSLAYSGGAIFTRDELNITNSEFANNKAGNGGALMLMHSYAVADITGSNFHDNQTLNTTDGWGGAILVFDSASATISSTTFNKNQSRRGGAVFVFLNASLALENNSTLSMNTATIGEGGGIYNEGTATLTNVTLSGNKSLNDGGGIYNEGTATLTNVTLSGNETTEDSGGGISNFYGNVTLTNATLSGNRALNFYGGGIYNGNGDIILTNVTLSGSLAYRGGGIYNNDTATLVNVTLSGNSATQSGGGIQLGSGTLNISNTIIAKGAQGANCLGFGGGSFNLSNDNSCGFGAGRDNVANLNLGPLANNGGSTQTHLPGSGSAAIDTGTGIACPSKDQRGVDRPKGLACDVGSVEVVPSPPTSTPTRTRTPTGTPTRTATKTPTRTLTTQACNAKPAKPSLTAPSNGATLTKARVTLKWLAANCAEFYRVIVKQNGNKVDGGKTTALSFKTKALPKGRAYKWFVKACNPPFGCTKSETRSFTLK